MQVWRPAGKPVILGQIKDNSHGYAGYPAQLVGSRALSETPVIRILGLAIPKLPQTKAWLANSSFAYWHG